MEGRRYVVAVHDKGAALNRALLKTAGMTQAELAAETGLAEASISRIVNGVVEPTKSTIDALLAFFSKRLGRPIRYEELFPRKKGRAA